MENLRAVVFDMDGVLVDSELHWKEVGSEFLRSIVPQWNDQLQRSIIGLSLYQIYEILVRDYDLELDRQTFVARYQSLSEEIYLRRTNLIPGSLECIDMLRGAGYRLALASSCPLSWIEMVIERFSLAEVFETVSSSDHVAARGKPAPDIYLYTCQNLDLEPECCLAIEDTEKGVASARSASLLCIGLRNGYNQQQDLSKANWIAEDFSEITRLVLNSR